MKGEKQGNALRCVFLCAIMKDNEDYFKSTINNNLDSTIETIMVPIKKMQTVFSHLQGGNEVVTGVVTGW